MDKRNLPRWNPPDPSAVLAAFDAGESVKALAARIGASRPTLTRWLGIHGRHRSRSEAERLKWAEIKRDPAAVKRQLGAAWRVARASDDEIERIVLARYSAELCISKRRLAEELRCSTSNIDRLLRKHGIRRDRTYLRAAIGKERSRRGNSISPWELPLLDALRSSGLVAVHQYAIGTSNVDIALPEARIAVEVERRHWNAAKSLRRERVEQILGAGWRIVVVYHPRNRKPLAATRIAEHLAALAQRLDLDPSVRGQYRVIRGSGEPVPVGRYDLHGFAAIV